MAASFLWGNAESSGIMKRSQDKRRRASRPLPRGETPERGSCSAASPQVAQVWAALTRVTTSRSLLQVQYSRLHHQFP